MKRRDISTGGHRVRYYEAGAGPAVILLHGAGGTARLWARVMGLLSGSFRLVAPDLPGFGGSEFYPEAATSEGYAEFIGEFMSALGISRASVVGSSMGGRAACIFAAGHPDNVDRLVLISPSGLDTPNFERLMDELGKAYAGRGPVDGLASAQETIKSLYENGGLSPLDKAIPGRITAPALILWGEEDGIIPASHSTLLSAAIPGSRTATIEAAGHLPHVQKHQETAILIKRFLQGDFKLDNSC